MNFIHKIRKCYQVKILLTKYNFLNGISPNIMPMKKFVIGNQRKEWDYWRCYEKIKQIKSSLKFMFFIFIFFGLIKSFKIIVIKTMRANNFKNWFYVFIYSEIYHLLSGIIM